MPESNPIGGHQAHARGDPRDIRLASTDRVLIVAPHPDDEVLAAGGLLQHAVDRQASVRIQYVTRGENNPWAQRVHEGRWRITAPDRERWACLRQREALASLTHLGLQPDCVRSLAFSDQGLTDLVMSGSRAFVELLADEIAFWKPTLLLVPATFDAHPDHSALGALAQFALAGPVISHPRPKTLAYVIHRARGPKPPGAERFTLTPAQIRQKRLAILCHRSQLRLRRRFLLEFAGATEEFHAIAGGRDTDGLHPVREVFTTDDALNIMIQRPKSLRTARPELLIAMEGASSESVRIMVQFDVRARWAYLLDGMRRNKPVPVAMRVLSDTVEFKIPRPWETGVGATPILFAKLDDPGTRRLGFFDSAGWRRFDAAELARGDDLHRGSEMTSPEAQGAAAVRVPAQDAQCEVAPEQL